MAELRVFMLDLMSFALSGRTECGSFFRTARSQRQEFVHYPIVLFDIPAQTGSDWEEIRGKLNLKKASDKHAWLLDREDILIPRQEHASSIKVTSQPGIKGYPDTSNAREFSWVPLMREVLGRCSDMEPLLTPNDPRNPLPSELRLACRSRRGRLETATFVKHLTMMEPNKIVEFDFSPRGQGDRALAELLVATIPLDVPRITISAFNHQTRGERWVTLGTQSMGTSICWWPISLRFWKIDQWMVDISCFIISYLLLLVKLDLPQWKCQRKWLRELNCLIPRSWTLFTILRKVEKVGRSVPLCSSTRGNLWIRIRKD